MCPLVTVYIEGLRMRVVGGEHRVALSGMACVGIRTYAFMYVFEMCNWMERLGAAT